MGVKTDLQHHQPTRRNASALLPQHRLARPGRQAALIALLALAGAQASWAENAPLDIFIGTLAVEKGQVVLTRCDLAQNRYFLRDAKGSNAVAAYARDGRPAYGEVIGAYWEKNGHPALDVEAIDNLTPGQSCHLFDPVK